MTIAQLIVILLACYGLHRLMSDLVVKWKKYEDEKGKKQASEKVNQLQKKFEEQRKEYEETRLVREDPKLKVIYDNKSSNLPVKHNMPIYPWEQEFMDKVMSEQEKKKRKNNLPEGESIEFEDENDSRDNK